MPVYKRTKRDGTTVYDVVVQNGYKQIWKRGFTLLREAEDEEARLVLAKGSRRNETRKTLDFLVPIWLDEVKETRKPSTWHDYETCMRLRILPRFGHKRLSDITPFELNDYIISLSAKPHVANKALTVMRIFYKWAIRQGLTSYDPTRAIKKMREDKREFNILSQEEAEQLLSVLESQERLLIMTELYTGLRSGELSALTWADVKPEYINVDKSYRRGDLDRPKNKNAIRRVYIPPFLSRELEQHRTFDTHPVFPGPDGGYLEPWTMTRKILYPALERAGIEKAIRFHDLRHTYASWMIAWGFNELFISRQLGHSTIQVTKDLYGHVVDSYAQGAMEDLEKILSKTLARSSEAGVSGGAEILRFPS